jgi:hypothetical protein
MASAALQLLMLLLMLMLKHVKSKFTPSALCISALRICS